MQRKKNPTRVVSIVRGHKVKIWPRAGRAWVDGVEMEVHRRGNGHMFNNLSGWAAGSCRRILIGSGLVVKLDDPSEMQREGSCDNQCYLEGRKYMRLRTRRWAKQYLAKTYDYGHGWLIQQHYDITPEVDPRSAVTLGECIERLDSWDIDPRYGGNCGVDADTGVPIIYDYAL